MRQLRLPVGIEDFAEIRRNEYYYVDKTQLIEQVLDRRNKVTLFTRPRRFGKTLNMSMLQYFFEIGMDPTLFDGLYIAQNKDLCDVYMGRYPVVSISLKGVDADSYEKARAQLIRIINKEARRHRALLEDEKMDAIDRELFVQFLDRQMEDDTITSSLQELTELLEIHFSQKVVVLIDEYDVPLAKAYENGYYDDMVLLLRNMFGNVLKSNDSLAFAVLTGCLRIAKESIFTGLNNFKVYSITDQEFDETFGFTDAEVKAMLQYYGLQDYFNVVREWYDGYRFGKADVYCPWDVVNHVDRIKSDPNARPEAYWINTSGNDLVKRFIDKATKTTRSEIESLIAGESIEKQIRLDLTYDEIDNSIDNLWSVLFTTGYLTKTGLTDAGAYKLVIPNKEVREVFKLQIQEWFKKSIFSNTEQLQNFWKAFAEGNTEKIEKYLNKILSNSVSVFDTRAREEEKESSYHNLLVGILTGNADWLVKSNAEAGEGFADIIVETDDPDAGIVVELKYTKEYKDMEQACQNALDQIKDRRYQEYLLNDGRNDILLYGMAFCKKRCRVVVERM